MAYYKKVFSLFFSPALLTLGAISKPVTPPNTPIYIITADGVLGAFDLDEDVDIKLTISGPKATRTLNVDYFNHQTGAYVIGDVVTLKESILGKISLTYTLKLKNRLSYNGLDIKFSIKEGANVLKEYNITLYPKEHNSILVNNYQYTPYIIKNRTFKINKDEIDQEEIFDFSNMIFDLSINNDNSLDLSPFFFIYDNKEKLNNLTDSKYLYINDPYKKLFPYIENRDNGDIKVKVKYATNTYGETYINFDQELFYNPKTLDMSFENKEDYVATDKFYIKNDIIESLKETKINFILGKTGRNDLTLNIPLKFYKDNNFIGACDDSDFCIIGGIKS